MLIDGKLVSKEILEDLKQKTQKLNEKPGLAVILANDNPASKVYVNSKEKRALEIGFRSYVYRFDRNVKQTDLIKLIHELNQNPSVHGILIQLPLFNHLNAQQLIEIINPKKDVDGFHPVNVGRLHSGLKPYAVCCTPLGIMKLFEYYNIELTAKSALVIGRSNIVGRPMAELLLQKNATVTLAHSKTTNLKAIAKNSDIIISATGKANMITADMVKKGAVIIDVGIIKNLEGKLHGEVDFENIENIASYITPVPGGVGPMTIAMLMQNTYNLFKEAQNAKL
ncbi:MAG: bifunctional 5,10-methylenetetrahydrofolate dehydrogenase/5,10-methenyltetrahydrofolate cyclohydrolase [Candidatus Gastranaerophilales bacterium]|nr:bifunctional 5,10-methylenetetrahydrofolate dehydrogenase/5,10-methenyltetrahydrofolate cyclohydrolase [Candidatus Gastranaerophilales bacterium]